MSDNHQVEPSYNLTFSATEWNVIRAGLYELQGKIGFPVIAKLERGLAEQAQKQQQARETAHE